MSALRRVSCRAVLCAALVTGSCAGGEGSGPDVEAEARNAAVPIDAASARSAQVEIAAPAVEVWAAISRVDEWGQFMSMVETCQLSGTGIGAVRFMKYRALTDFSAERIDVIDPWSMTLQYHLIDSPLSTTGLSTRVDVSALSKTRSRVTWTWSPGAGTRSPELERFAKDTQAAGLADLKKLFEPRAVARLLIPAPPAAVWGAIVAFWNDGTTLDTTVESSRLLQSHGETFRVTKFKDKVSWAIERLDAWDDAAMSLTYTVVGSSFPFAKFTSTVSVTPAGQGSLMVWDGRYVPVADPAEVDRFVQDTLTAGVKTVEARFKP